MSEAEEYAKAIQATAKLGEKGLDVAEKTGSFFSRVLKEPINEISGILTDKLKFIRWHRLIKMADNVDAILAKRGIKETRAVLPKIALPIMEEATLEEELSLQSLWEQLLANAMDPNFNNEIRYGFIDMIKNITALEAKLMYEFYKIEKGSNHLEPITEVYNYQLHKGQLMLILEINEGQYALAVNNLMRMQLISPSFFRTIGEIGGPIFKGFDAITMTPLGVKFVEACMQ